MIIVVTIVSILFLLSVPNIQTTLGIVNNKADQAKCKVVDAAIVQYRLKHNEDAIDVSQLIQDDLLKEEQVLLSDGTQIQISNGQAYIP